MLKGVGKVEIKRIATFVVVLAVGFVAGVWLRGDDTMGPGRVEASVYRCAMHPTVVSDTPGSCPVCGMDLVMDRQEDHQHETAGESKERKILSWRAPMDPDYTMQKPGKSPMGMDLVPVYEDEVMGGGGGVKIDPRTVQNMGVKTALVERKSLSRTVRTIGRVDYNETRMTDVNTKVMGWVEKLFVDYTGKVVRKGEPLLELYSPELVGAQEEYLTALDYSRRLKERAAADVMSGAFDLLKSAKQRLLYWDITEKQISDLEKTREVKRTMTIYSPQEGVVVHKEVFEGAHIEAGQHLYRISDLSRVWVYADVYEYELPWVQVGQQAEVELSYEPGHKFHGEVTFIYPFLESKTRTVKVRMVFPNPEMKLKPGMYANVRIKPLVSRDALVVPSQAVIRSGERNTVILALGEGRFMPRDIVIGVQADEVYEVLNGLREGQPIVMSAQFLIDSESNLKAALSSMAGDPSNSVQEGKPNAH